MKIGIFINVFEGKMRNDFQYCNKMYMLKENHVTDEQVNVRLYLTNICFVETCMLLKMIGR